MSFSAEFSDDCINWTAYKPCPEQIARGVFDCRGCDMFFPADVIEVNLVQEIGPTDYPDMSAVGIIEAGGLGSVLRTTAVSRALRQVNPDVQIRWFSNARGVELLQHAPGVEPVLVEDGLTNPDLVSSLDGVINFETDQSVLALARQARAIAGFRVNAFGRFVATDTARKLLHMQVSDDYRLHNQETFQQILVEAAGLTGEPGYDIDISPHHTKAANTLIATAFKDHVPPVLVGLNIGTSEKGIARRWTPEGFASVANDLVIRDQETGIVILSGPDDAEQLARTKPLLIKDPRVQVLPSNLDSATFLALMGQMDSVVTSDTFGFHAAKSQNVATTLLSSAIPLGELETTSDDIVIEADCMGICLRGCQRAVTGSSCLEMVVPAVVSAAVQITPRHSNALVA